jgi:hypothetical protein
LALLEPERPLDPSRLNDPSDLGVLLMASHLRRTFGSEWAQKFESSFPLRPHPTDPLVVLFATNHRTAPTSEPTSASF